MKIPPMGAELFHEDAQTDKQEEAKSLFSNLRKGTKKSIKMRYI